jgi:hypothetical protein
MTVVAVSLGGGRGEQSPDLLGLGHHAYSVESGEWPRQIGPDSVTLVHGLELEELQRPGYYLGGCQVGVVKSGLSRERHR